jgi:signal transduction histidine kinase
MARRRSPSLLWKIGLSTAVAITVLLAIAGYFVQAQTRETLSRNLENELQENFRAYESLWQARAELLRSVSRVLSSMSDVRAAFQTRDRATIKDTANEIWAQVSESAGMFLVTDSRGDVIASLGGAPPSGGMEAVRDAIPRFPAQSEGFSFHGGVLYELVVTPVYVQSPAGPALINVLVAGFPVDQKVVLDLKERTGGNDFVFLQNGGAVASTLSADETATVAREYHRGSGLQTASLPGRDLAVLGRTLHDVSGAPAGDLLIVHNFDVLSRDLASLEIKLFLIWAAAIIAGVAVSIVLARRILLPIRELDHAAARIARQEYDTRVPQAGDDEFGRLAGTFNGMCQSIQEARNELIRQEQLSTIGRLSSSIVHDLRNPLASIYGGAEMMIDGDLSPQQMHRVAGNIYRSSRVIKDMLQELVDVSRGRTQMPENCRLSDLINDAVDASADLAARQGVEIHTSVDPGIELPVEPGRMERVFLNLIGNAVEAMPEGGRIDISAARKDNSVLVAVDDDGPGVPPEVRDRLFQPFATTRRNGTGLGLALSRKTVVDHGGDLWLENSKGAAGAHFRLRLPC